MYWYDDAKTGGNCHLPASWAVQYKDTDGQWKPVAEASAAGVEEDKLNKVTFTPVTTSALRLTVQLQDNLSAGILEWKVGD